MDQKKHIKSSKQTPKSNPEWEVAMKRHDVSNLLALS